MIKKYAALLILAAVIASNLFLGLPRLGTYSAVDEPYWTYGRTSKFWTAIDQHRWKSTNVNDKPGITVAILSGFGLLKYDPMRYESIRGEVKTDRQLADIDGINFFFRLPIFLFCTLMLPVFYFFLRKLLGRTTALLASVFIGLSPILLGISLIINPDSLLWIFLPLSLLSYLTFQKEKKFPYLATSGVFLGLSLLTKYVANILYIFFLFLPFLQYVLSGEKSDLKEFLRKSFGEYLALAAISVATFYVLYPATWAHPNVLLEGTFGSKALEKTWPLFAGIVALIAADTALLGNRMTRPILGFLSKHKNPLATILISVFIGTVLLTLADTYLGMKPFDLEGILASPKGIGAAENGFATAATGALLADMYSLIFGMHPMLFLFLIIGLLTALEKKTDRVRERNIVISFSLFILLYYLASSVNDVVSTVRYQIILYPLALIIAAIGAARILSHKRIREYLPSLPATAVIALILAVSLIRIRPFYFAYASPLLPERYLLNTKDMGDGSYEAAAYLNSLPGARDMTVWSDKGAVCTEFVGTCNIGFSNKDLKGKTFDHFVISSGRKSRSLKLSGSANDIIDFRKIYDENTASEYKVTIGGRPNNFVKVISAEILK